MASRSRAKSQAERLREALKATRVSRRELAVALLDNSGDAKQVSSKKSQIAKWLGGDGISDENARKIADAFTRLGHPYTERAFMKSPTAPRTWHEEMAELRSVQEQILEELRHLREG